MRPIIALVLLSILSVGHAQQKSGKGGVLDSGDHRGVYIGAGVGSFDYDERIPAALAADLFAILGPLGFTGSIAGGISDTTSAWKLYGGYNFNQYFGIEGSFGATGTISTNLVAGSVPGIGNVTYTVEQEHDVIAVRAMGRMPLSWGSVFGGVGLYDGEADITETVTGGALGSLSGGFEAEEDGVTVIGGVQWDFSAVTLRLEYEWWDIDDADAFALGAGLHWSF